MRISIQFLSSLSSSERKNQRSCDHTSCIFKFWVSSFEFQVPRLKTRPALELAGAQLARRKFDGSADRDEERVINRLHHVADGESLPILTRHAAQAFEREDAVQPAVAGDRETRMAVRGQDAVDKLADPHL